MIIKQDKRKLPNTARTRSPGERRGCMVGVPAFSPVPAARCRQAGCVTEVGSGKMALSRPTHQPPAGTAAASPAPAPGAGVRGVRDG
ncbi:MAG TPA: hypothetical protein VLD65_01110 [Anaerolineales bacterium]|nr:hypothetical protein [Anaerolineales bacterium]